MRGRLAHGRWRPGRRGSGLLALVWAGLHGVAARPVVAMAVNMAAEAEAS